MALIDIVTTSTDNKFGLFILKSDDGAIIRRYESDPKNGYIVLLQRRLKTEQLFSGTKLVKSTRQCLINGEIDMLEMQVQAWAQGTTIPGQIVSRDVLESDLPESMRNSKSLERNAKTAGKDGVPLTLHGEQIYQSRFYTTDMKAEDVRIQHDNGAEIRTANAIAKANAVPVSSADAKL